MLITLQPTSETAPARGHAELVGATGAARPWSRFIHSDAMVFIGVVLVVMLKMMWWVFVWIMVVLLALTVGAISGLFSSSRRSGSTFRGSRSW